MSVVSIYNDLARSDLWRFPLASIYCSTSWSGRWTGVVQSKSNAGTVHSDVDDRSDAETDESCVLYFFQASVQSNKNPTITNFVWSSVIDQEIYQWPVDTQQ